MRRVSLPVFLVLYHGAHRLKPNSRIHNLTFIALAFKSSQDSECLLANFLSLPVPNSVLLKF